MLSHQLSVTKDTCATTRLHATHRMPGSLPALAAHMTCGAQDLLCLMGPVGRAQLLAAFAAVVGDDVVDVHVLGMEENKLAVAHDR